MTRIPSSVLATRLLTLAVCFLACCSAPVEAQTLFLENYGRGVVRHWLPSTYDPAEPMPLVMMLHGYGGSGLGMEMDLDLPDLVEAQEFLLVSPDGLPDGFGFRFWNATAACCDFSGSSPDDSGYLRSILDSLVANYAIDRTRIYCCGFSNGGFMSHRMACDHASLLAGVVNMSGSTDANPAFCDPQNPVHYLQVHGTADPVILYAGGAILGVPYPGALTSVESWASYNLCPGGLGFVESIDAAFAIAGFETDVESYDPGTGGVTTELWTVAGGVHLPYPRPPLNDQLLETLFARPKVQTPFVRGDVNLDGGIDISDPVALLGILFQSLTSYPACDAPQDANGDDAVDVSDAIWLLNFSFGSGPTPPAPFPSCGLEPTPSRRRLCLDYSCP